MEKKALCADNIKIALVSLQHDAEIRPSVGLVYVATYLRDRCGIKNIRIIDKRFDNVQKEIEKFLPDIIGVGPMTINYPDAVEFAMEFKKTNSTPIILGGIHISTLPSSMKPCFDVSVIGEGEETMAELVNLYIKKGRFEADDLKKIKGLVFLSNGQLIKTPSRPPLELDSLPFPDFEFLNKKYFDEQEIPGANIVAVKAFIITSRGCPYKCKFCSTSHFWGKIRLHSPKYAANLIKYSMDKYDATYINIMDDLFTINAERLRSIKKELDKLGVTDKIVAMDCQPRANLVNDELCQAMKDLKVKVVCFGFESGSERVLNWLKSGSVTVDMNKNAIIMCKKYGFVVYGCFIFGSPMEKIEDVKKTLDFIDFAIKNKVDYMWSFIATPFPNTPFWDIALERGRVSNDMDFKLLDHHYIDDPLLLDSDVDKKEFKRLFLEGRQKLRTLKIKMAVDFFKSYPFKSIEMFVKSPTYYFTRLIKQIYKH